jgi:hypothetical protein
MPNTTQWGLVEAPDENHDVLSHILPITPILPFKTHRAAQAFLDRMESLGDPVITDEDNNVVATFTGHTLSPSCLCGPTPRDSGLLVHNQPN